MARNILDTIHEEVREGNDQASSILLSLIVLDCKFVLAFNIGRIHRNQVEIIPIIRVHGLTHNFSTTEYSYSHMIQMSDIALRCSVPN